MNEIQIYRKARMLIDKQKNYTKFAWLILIITMVNALVMVSLPLLDWATYVTCFVPITGAIVLLVIAINKELILGKKFPKIYNKKYDNLFVNKIERRSTERAQPNQNNIKISNYGLEYLDEHYDAYKDDKQKYSNALYNAIQNTNLVEEIRFYEKFKNFINDMELYRMKVIVF